jgi:hypothetical protein
MIQKPKLIPEARRAWRMFSVQVAALAIAWGAMPTDLQAAVLTAVGVPAERVPAVFGLLFLIGRLVAQPGAK